MTSVSSKYTIELRSPSGDLLADFSGRAKDRRLVKSRNEADEISWNLDLAEYERYCSLSGIHPGQLPVVGQTEVRVKRGGTYLSGGQIVYAAPRITADNQVYEMRATGFLNLLAGRHTAAERVFAAADGSTIAWTLIDESQSLTNGDFGITQGNLATVGNHDRTYKRTVLKDAIKGLASLKTSSFDFEFTHDKVFHTYVSQGSPRPDIIFEAGTNILEYALPRDATALANEVTALGAGIGEQGAAITAQGDVNSQLTYKLRQRAITSNGTTDENGGVTDAAEAEVNAWAFPIEIIELTVDGNGRHSITDFGIGDRVKVILGQYDTTRHINGLYRVEKYELTIDDNDSEQIKLYLS